MSLTKQDKQWLEKLVTLSVDEQHLINVFFRDMYSTMKIYGMQAATDDRAASLEGAMIRFLIESSNDVGIKNG